MDDLFEDFNMFGMKQDQVHDHLDNMRKQSEISPLSDTQEKLLAIIPIIPSFLSICGSSMIVYLVTSQAKRKLTPYRRLLLGMSLCDIFSSTIMPLQSFLLPKETSHRVWAFGNDATCTFLGFGTQFAFSAVLYNAFLSYYFLLTVRFGFKEQDISKFIEPIMHIMCIGYPTITAVIGAIFGMYHETEIGALCYVTDYPDGCGNDHIITIDQDEQEEWNTNNTTSHQQQQQQDTTYIPCQSDTIAWIFGGIIMIFLMFSLIINNLLIYLHVRSTIRRGQLRYAHGGASFTTSRTSSTTNNANDAATSHNNGTSERRQSYFSSFRQQSSLLFSFRQQQNDNNNNQVVDSQTRRIRSVATQAFLYVGACVLSYFALMVLRILEGLTFNAEDEGRLFPLLVMQATFLPLQGFFNFLVFIRPNYLNIRKQNANQSKWWAFQKAITPQRNNNVNHTVATNNTSRRRSFLLSSARWSVSLAGSSRKFGSMLMSRLHKSHDKGGEGDHYSQDGTVNQNVSAMMYDSHQMNAGGSEQENVIVQGREHSIQE